MIDERGKRFSAAERRIAEYLARHGPAVVSVPEGYGAGTVAVYAGGHEFDDDDIAWPQGSDIPLQSEYPAMIEIRDTSGDLLRQQEIARKIFGALRSAGRHRAVYIDDMQKILDSYSPEEYLSNTGEDWAHNTANPFSMTRRGGHKCLTTVSA